MRSSSASSTPASNSIARTSASRSVDPSSFKFVGLLSVQVACWALYTGLSVAVLPIYTRVWLLPLVGRWHTDSRHVPSPIPSQFHGRRANTRRPLAMLNWFFGARTLDDYLQAGHFAPALEILDGALKAQPEEPELLEKRALVLERLGRGAEAGEVLVKLAKRFADRGFGLRAIALLKKS